MKPAPFEYVRASSVDHVLDQLQEYGREAKILAGGQSLIPTMNFRMANPGVLLDVNSLDTLSYIEELEEGARIGAMTRQSMLEDSQMIGEQYTIFNEVMPHIAHRQIRNRGTVGGSLAHADPAAELPAVMVALQAEFTIKNAEETREVSADTFFEGLFETDLAQEELLVNIDIPPFPPDGGWGFDEVQRRHGDFAIVGAVAVLRTDDTVCQDARLVLFSGGVGPVRAEEAETVLMDEELSSECIEEAARVATESDFMSVPDVHASEAYRSHLARTLSERVLTQARESACGEAHPV